MTDADSSDPVTAHRVETDDGLGLHVVERGPRDGEVVLLAHGWPDTHVVWRHQVPALAAAGYRVVTFDQRGFGSSDVPAEIEGSHVFKAMVDIGTILDALDVDEVHLVGHDWGAPPCWLTATFAPERVQSLTAMSVGHPRAFRDAGLEQQQKSFYMLLFQFVDIAEEWLRADDWKNMRQLIGDDENWSGRRAELEKPGALTASLNWYRANVGPETLVNAQAELPNVTTPTLGMMGADDWALLDTQMISSRDYVDGAFRYVEIADAAHWLQTDQPDAVNALLIDWIASNG